GESMISAAASATARQFLGLATQLLHAGGIAVKCESSGMAHAAPRWQKFDANADRDAFNFFTALYLAYVFSPISNGPDLYTCGMHLLGAPDLILNQSVIQSQITPEMNAAAIAIKLFQ